MLIKDILKHFEKSTENVIKIEEETPHIDNYIFTQQIIENYYKLFRFLDGDKSAVNLYGDFGSGKSHFINVFNYMLKNKNSNKIPKEIDNFKPVKAYNIDLSLHTNFANISEILSKKYLHTTEIMSSDKILEKLSLMNNEEKVVFIFDEIESYSKLKNISLDLQGLIHASESFFKNIKFIFISQNKFSNIDYLKPVQNRISLYLHLDDYNIEEVLFERILKKNDESVVEDIFEKNYEDIIYRTPEIKIKNNYKISENNNNKKLFSRIHPLQPYQIDVLESILKQGKNLSNRTLIFTIHKIIKEKYLEKNVEKWIKISDIYDAIFEDNETNELYKTLYILEKTLFSEFGIPEKTLINFMYSTFIEPREDAEKKTKILLKKLFEENRVYLLNGNIKISSEEIIKIENMIKEKIKKEKSSLTKEIMSIFLNKKLGTNELKNINISFNHHKIQNKNSSRSLEIFYNENEMKLRRQAIKNKETIYLLLEKSSKVDKLTKEISVVKNILSNEKNERTLTYLQNKKRSLIQDLFDELNILTNNSLLINSVNKPIKIANFPNDLIKYYKENFERQNGEILSQKELKEYQQFLENILFEIKVFPTIKLYIKDMDFDENKKDKTVAENNYKIFKKTFETFWKEKFNEKISLKKYQSNYKNMSLHDLI